MRVSVFTLNADRGETDVKNLHSWRLEDKQMPSEGKKKRELTGIWFKGTSTCPRKSSRVWQKRQRESHRGDDTHRHRGIALWNIFWEWGTDTFPQEYATSLWSFYCISSSCVSRFLIRPWDTSYSPCNTRLFPFKQGESFDLSYSFTNVLVWGTNRIMFLQFSMNGCIVSPVKSLSSVFVQRTDSILHSRGQHWEQMNRFGRSECPTEQASSIDLIQSVKK